MTRKHYQAIADVLAAERGLCSPDHERTAIQRIDNLTRSLADIMAQDNPRFDRERFYKAAGLPPLD